MDESQQKDHYFVGAALGNAEDWQLISERLATLRSSAASTYGTPADAEFHGHPLMHGRGDWEVLNRRYREAGNTYLRALSTMDDLNISFFICGVDVRRLNARYRYPDRPHELCMRHVLERLNEFANNQQLGLIKVIADETSEQHHLQESLRTSHNIGTSGYRPSNLEHILEPIEFANSAKTDGLQVVDLGLYIKQREYHIPREANKKAEMLRTRLLDKLEPFIEVFHVWLP